MSDLPQIPYDILTSLSRNLLASLNPAQAPAIQAGWHDQVIRSFIMDALSHHKISALIHHLDCAEQEALIGGVEPLILEDLPEDILTFYDRSLRLAARGGSAFGYTRPDDMLELAVA